MLSLKYSLLIYVFLMRNRDQIFELLKKYNSCRPCVHRRELVISQIRERKLLPRILDEETLVDLHENFLITQDPWIHLKGEGDSYLNTYIYPPGYVFDTDYWWENLVTRLLLYFSIENDCFTNNPHLLGYFVPFQLEHFIDVIKYKKDFVEETEEYVRKLYYKVLYGDNMDRIFFISTQFCYTLLPFEVQLPVLSRIKNTFHIIFEKVPPLYRKYFTKGLGRYGYKQDFVKDSKKVTELFNKYLLKGAEKDLEEFCDKIEKPVEGDIDKYGAYIETDDETDVVIYTERYIERFIQTDVETSISTYVETPFSTYVEKGEEYFDPDVEKGEECFIAGYKIGFERGIELLEEYFINREEKGTEFYENEFEGGVYRGVIIDNSLIVNSDKRRSRIELLRMKKYGNRVGF